MQRTEETQVPAFKLAAGRPEAMSDELSLTTRWFWRFEPSESSGSQAQLAMLRNWNPTQAREWCNKAHLRFLVQRDDILRHSNATKAMRSPQWHTHCGATTLLDLCLPVMVVSLYALNWLSTLNVIGWQYVKCHNMLLHKKMKSQLLILVRTAASHTTLLYSSAL